MTMAGRVSAVVMSAVLLVDGPASASAMTSVFTRDYVRAAGRPTTVVDTFTACDPSGTFRLVVLNGPEGRARISSGEILVNGREIVQERDFNQQVVRIERRLTNVLAENRLAVQLRSQPGAAIRLTIEGDQACGARITSPAPGSILTEPLALVRGTVAMGSDGNVGVTVNGVPAFVETGNFAALVPLSPETTSLTARAIDFAGEVGGETIPVTVQVSASEPTLRLAPTPAGGVAPLMVGFRLSSLVPVLAVKLDGDGDGSVDFEGHDLERQTFTYTRPGLYVPIVQATDDRGAHHAAMAVIQVADPTALDGRLQAIWHGLKAALRAGDLARAGTFIHGEARAAYVDQLNRFSPVTLANIDQHMTAIQLVEVGAGGAQYEMLREHDGQTLSFAVWFQLDQDGLWRLRRF